MNEARRSDHGEEHPPSSGRVEITWPQGEVGPPTYANAFMSQFTSDEFFLTFGQFTPPPPEVQLDEVEALSARVTVRLALSPGRMKALIRTLQANYEKWETQRAEWEPDETESDPERTAVNVSVPTTDRRGPQEPPVAEATDYVWPAEEDLTRMYARVADADRALAAEGISEYARALARVDEHDEHNAGSQAG